MAPRLEQRVIRWSGILALLMGFTGAPAVFAADRPPEETVRQYIQAVYSRNYAEAYPLISAADKLYKAQAEYLRENVSFTGTTGELAAQLASYIMVKNPRTEIDGDRATVLLDLSLPDGNHPKLRTLLLEFDEDRLEALPEAERQEIAHTLSEMDERGALPIITGEERFELVKDTDGWKVYLNWGRTVRVRFVGEVKNDLPWEFEPVQAEVRAPPGETLRTTFRAKNLSDSPITGKARHVILPSEEYLEVIQCFCFIEQTLDPGEEVEMPVFFRVKWDAPPDLESIEMRYEFYPVEHFKEEWEATDGRTRSKAR
jgi:cytochrome c oxidase assembly protein Cox11